MTSRLRVVTLALCFFAPLACSDGPSGPEPADASDTPNDTPDDAADGSADSGDDVVDAADTPVDGGDTGPTRTTVSDTVAVDTVGFVLRREPGDVVPAAWAEALVDGTRISTRGCGDWGLAEVPGVGNEPTPGAHRTCDFDTLRTIETVAALDDGRVVVGLTVENRGPDVVVVTRLSPVVTDASEGGGLFVGDDATRTRILDDGTAVFVDIDVHTHIPTYPPSLLITALLPIPHRGEFVSNWNHAVADLDGGGHWVAGALSVERAIPTFGLTLGDTVDGAGRRGFASLHVDQSLAFHGKPVGPGERLAAEAVLLDFTSETVFTALERYAAAIADHMGRRPWTETHAVPNGWNSWTGSGSTGGLGTNIDETLIRECLAIMAREFAPFGVEYFQIDDGWMVTEGDWVANDRFPSGMQALLDDVTAAGLIPGLWASAFLASETSSIADEHPDWMLPRDNDVTHGAYVPDDDLYPLDFTNPEVLSWMRELATALRDDWGLGWFKLDFAYFVLSHRPNHDRSLTTVEAYRSGLAALRDGLGDDAFLLGIGMFGPHWGIADGMRTTLDDGPLWEEANPFQVGGTGNNLKNAVRIGARRWYFHDNLLVNHGDLLFFRSDRSHPEVTLTFEEARTFASFVGLSGSIVKFGEDLRTLTPEQIRTWRRLLPVYGPAARPLDVFTRVYPEVFHLRVEGSRAGWPGEWDVVGLFNWGRNWDLSGERRSSMPDEARTLGATWSELGHPTDEVLLAHELWTWEFLGEVSGELSLEVAPHAAALVALHAPAGRPQVLATDRHVTQGGTDLVAERWDELSGVLELDVQVDHGGPDAVDMPVRIRFAVPAPWAFHEATVAPPEQEAVPIEAAASTAHGYQLVDVTITPGSAGTHTLALAFSMGP